MIYPLLLIGLIGVLEYYLWATALERWRKSIATTLILLLSVASGLLIAHGFSQLSALIALISAYRIVNLLRIIDGRIRPDHLFHTVRRTTLWLLGTQIICVALATIINLFDSSLLLGFYLLAAVQLIAAGTFLYSTFRTADRIFAPVDTDGITERDLPSLSVLIPARNETAELEACLASLIASNYQKLEIIVLDDCSQNKRTPEIIRQFAHDGVQFIQGEVPPEHWLAKNYAYEQLAVAANGEILLYCGVDTRFEPGSLKQLVKIMNAKHKTMLSVLPQNISPERSRPLSRITQINRYAWELVLPRRIFNKPPVLSTCWLISRDALKKAGGFKAVRRSVLPERYLARYLAEGGDTYGFVGSDAQLAVSSHKSQTEQRATAIRVRYPQLHRRPEAVLLVSLAELLLLTLPCILCVGAIVAGNWLLLVPSALAWIINSITYTKVASLTYRRFVGSAALTMPFAALYDVALLNYSMWQYEFHEVLWKGRNICMPVMDTIPHLPRLR